MADQKSCAMVSVMEALGQAVQSKSAGCWLGRVEQETLTDKPSLAAIY